MALPLKHQTEDEKLLDLLVPSWLDGLWLFLVSSLLLILLNISASWQYLTGHIFGNEVQTADYSLITDPLLHFINNLDMPLLLLLWGLFGCLVFGAILLIQKANRTIKQEFEESRYVSGAGVPDRNYWHAEIRTDVLFVGTGIGWLAYMILYFAGLLPWISHLFFVGLYGSWGSSYKVLISLAAQALAILIFARLTQLLLNTWHEIRPSE